MIRLNHKENPYLLCYNFQYRGMDISSIQKFYYNQQVIIAGNLGNQLVFQNQIPFLYDTKSIDYCHDSIEL